MSSPFHPEPPPQNELERLLLKAGEEPALQGRMYRLLWESQLFVFVPDHPEMRDVLLPLRNGEEFVFCMCPHEKGTFMAVFTSEAVADWAAAQIPSVKPAMANLPGEVLFRLAETAKVWVRVNHGTTGAAVLGPEAVAWMMHRGWTRLRRGGPGDGPTLVRAEDWEVPEPLLEAIGRFCEERNGAFSVFGFFNVPDTSVPIEFNDMRLLVWLRETDDTFYEDFVAMVSEVDTPGLIVSCEGVTSDKAGAIKYFQRHTPLWPVV